MVAVGGGPSQFGTSGEVGASTAGAGLMFVVVPVLPSVPCDRCCCLYVPLCNTRAALCNGSDVTGGAGVGR